MLETKNLCYEYNLDPKNPQKAVNNLNISLNFGDALGIIGKTGSGKSTFGQLLSGLLSPTSGDITFKNINLKDYSTPICFDIGFVCQYPENQLFCKSVYDDIAFGLKNKGASENDIQKCVINAAKFSGLDLNLLNKSPLELSGGEKRKCAIAGIIAMNPSVLILDEPTSALDPVGRKQLLTSLKNYQKNQNKILIIISHVMEEIAYLCNKILVMENGNQLLFGSSQNIFDNYEILKEIGLDVPLTKKIVYNINKKFPQFDKSIITPEKAKKEILKFISSSKN